MTPEELKIEIEDLLMDIEEAECRLCDLREIAEEMMENGI